MCSLVQETSGDWGAEVAFEPGTQWVQFNKWGDHSKENNTVWKHDFLHVDLILQKPWPNLAVLSHSFHQSCLSKESQRMLLGLCSSSADNYVYRQHCLCYIVHPVEERILLKFKGSTLEKTQGMCTRQTPNISSICMNFVFEEITPVNHHCSFIMVQSVSHC